MSAVTSTLGTIVVLILALFADTTSLSTNSHGVRTRSMPSAARPQPSPLFAVANPLKVLKNKNNRRGTNVLRVETVAEYKEKVVEERERITVVRFYSSYCRSCRASEPLFYRLASDYRRDARGEGGERSASPASSSGPVIGVNFVEVPLTKDTSVLHEALGVPSLPWTHIYHPEAGLVEERRVSKKYIEEVRACLRCYVYGECDLEDAPADCMNVYGECVIDGN